MLRTKSAGLSMSLQFLTFGVIVAPDSTLQKYSTIVVKPYPLYPPKYSTYLLVIRVDILMRITNICLINKSPILKIAKRQYGNPFSKVPRRQAQCSEFVEYFA